MRYNAVNSYFRVTGAKLLIILIVVAVLLRSVPLVLNETCYADDCLRYFAYIEGHLDTPEPMFQMANVLHMMGMPAFFAIKLLIWITPLVFSLGLYLLLRKRVSENTMLLAIFFANASLSFNLFWMVLLKNAMMIMFFPFFLYFFLEGHRWKAIFFLACMAMSHMTFILLILPVIAYSLYYDDDKVFPAYMLLVALLFSLYYLQSPQAAIAVAGGGPNLNYFFIDIFLLFFAIFSDNDSIKWVLVFNAVIAGLSALFVHESWRLMIMLNVPALLGAVLYIDKKKTMENIGLVYAAVTIILFAAYALTLRPYILL